MGAAEFISLIAIGLNVLLGALLKWLRDDITKNADKIRDNERQITEIKVASANRAGRLDELIKTFQEFMNEFD